MLFIFGFNIFSGKKPEEIEFTNEICKHIVSGSDIGQVSRQCGKPVIRGRTSGKKWCSVDESHHVEGPEDPK